MNSAAIDGIAPGLTGWGGWYWPLGGGGGGWCWGADAAVTSFRLRSSDTGALRGAGAGPHHRRSSAGGGRGLPAPGAAGAAVCSPCRERAAIGPCAIQGVSTGPRPEELRQAELELPEAFAAWPGNWWSSTWPRVTDRASGGYGRAYAALTAAGTYTRLTLGEP